jgi:DNA-binding transcriptional regulator LsrR (DeoR family)
MDDNRLELLGQVATWYYEDNMGQTEIAERIGRSRSMVSRMLNEARELGLVEIRVRFPLKADAALAAQLCQEFGLTQARVLATPPVDDFPTLLRRIGRLGAYYLEEILRDNITLGIGWGATSHALVKALPSIPLENAVVAQMMGSIGRGDPLVDGSELARWLSQKLNATHHYLPAPLIVESETVARALLNDPLVAETLSLARQADITLVGIGPVNSKISGLYRTGYLSDDDMERLVRAGVVGDLAGHMLDIHGHVADVPENRRLVVQDLESLKRVPHVIGVAGGKLKVPVILAALRSGCLNALITDAITATEILEIQTKKLPLTVLVRPS